MKFIFSGTKDLLRGKLSKFGKQKLLIRCTRPKAIATFILGSWTFFILLYFILAATKEKLDGVGQFGDFFGSLNTLFSGAALAGVIVSLMMQRRELRLQRREMQLTRSEMKDQKTVMEKQQVALDEQALVWEQQRFDNFFFSLLERYSAIKAELSVSFSRGGQRYTRTGEEFFDYFEQDINKHISPKRSSTLIATLQSYDFKAYINILAELFSLLPKIPETSPFKEQYANILSGGLSRGEQLAIFFYAIRENNLALQNAAAEYTLLRNVIDDDEYILTLDDYYPHYDKKAFGIALLTCNHTNITDNIAN